MYSKHKVIDAYDAYMPNKPSFVHDDYGVSMRIECFHLYTGYVFANRRGRRGFTYGVDKCKARASGRGIKLDSHYIGKCET